MEDASDISDLRPPKTPLDPLEFLSRSWVVSALQLSKSKSLFSGDESITEDIAGEHEDDAELPSPAALAGSPFCFASSATSQLVLERIMSQEGLPLASGRLSHSSGPINVGYLKDSPVDACDVDDLKDIRTVTVANKTLLPAGSNRTVKRWLKDRREMKKQETRVHNAKLHAAVSVAGVAAAIASVAVATATASVEFCLKEHSASTDMAVASAATLVATQCVKAAEAIGADHDQLAALVGSAVNVRNSDDIVTLTAAAATALRGEATVRSRALKEAWDIVAVIPVEKSGIDSSFDHYLRQAKQQKRPAAANDNEYGDGKGLGYEANFLGICSQRVLARGAELLKLTRKGDLHWKIVSVYISKMGQVILKMKSKHIAGTFTKKKKCVVVEVCKEVAAWPGRHLLEGGDHWRYFGLKTAEGRVIEFECRTEREHEIWTEGVAHLFDISREPR